VRAKLELAEFMMALGDKHELTLCEEWWILSERLSSIAQSCVVQERRKR
jgi:hypothetical protein